MNLNPYKSVNDFEAALCTYTGAPFAVAVGSGSAALLLCLIACKRMTSAVEIPKRTYVSVPQQIKIAGFDVEWRDEDWRGVYQLKPLPVWDCARRFTSGMYRAGQFQCLSFATNKILGIEQGGAILHDSEPLDSWFRKMRYDGRTPGIDPREDTFDVNGHHCPMLPSIATLLIGKLYHLPQHNEDMPDYPYPDLSVHPAFA